MANNKTTVAVLTTALVLVVAGTAAYALTRKPSIKLDAQGFPLNPKQGDTFMKDGRLYTFKDGVWTTEQGGQGGTGTRPIGGACEVITTNPDGSKSSCKGYYRVGPDGISYCEPCEGAGSFNRVNADCFFACTQRGLDRGFCLDLCSWGTRTGISVSGSLIDQFQDYSGRQVVIGPRVGPDIICYRVVSSVAGVAPVCHKYIRRYYRGRWEGYELINQVGNICCYRRIR